MMPTLEDRVQRLEDIAAITTLTSRYGEAINQGWGGRLVNYPLLRDVFTEDAQWISDSLGVDASGIDEIEAVMRRYNPDGSFAMHSFTNPVIEIDGDHATGRWLIWVAVGPDTPNEVFQSEDLEYVRSASGWRISRLVLHFGQTLFPTI